MSLERFAERGQEWLRTHSFVFNEKISELYSSAALWHHGVKGQKWGVRNGPPYPIKRSLKNAVGNDIIEVERTTLTGEPNSVTQRVGKNGGVERNYYGEDGRQIKQVSNNDHGNPTRHPYGEKGEHAHDYIYNENGTLERRTTRDLTDEERKENADIL